MKNTIRSIVFVVILAGICAWGAVAQDFSFSLDNIYFYNAKRVPWYPGFLADAGIDIPSGAEVTLGYDGITLVDNSRTTLLLRVGGGLDERMYNLTSAYIVSTEGLGYVTASPLDPDLAADERYYSLKTFNSDSALQTDTADNYSAEYAQIRALLGLGIDQEVPLSGYEVSPLSTRLYYNFLFADNIPDEAMLSDKNDVMQKKQIIFLSDEPDRQRYIISKFDLSVLWDLMDNPNPVVDHGTLQGYSAWAYFEIAPGFLNPSIDPGHTSEGQYFAPVNGVTASYYRTGMHMSFNRQLFDIDPNSDMNKFSGFLGTNFTVDWFDALGASGRIPLEVRMLDEDYLRRFRSEANVGVYTQLPEFKSVKMFWNNRIRYLFDNEFAENNAFLTYDASGWDATAREYTSYALSGERAIAYGATYLETEFYAEFFSAVKLGALLRLNLSNTSLTPPSGPTGTPLPVLEIEILFP